MQIKMFSLLAIICLLSINAEVPTHCGSLRCGAENRESGVGNRKSVRPQARQNWRTRAQQTYYAGPGREQTPPTDINEVLIGYFGPNDVSHPEAGDMWRAAVLAVEEANHAGGCNGLPFHLVPGWSDSPWTAGATHVVRMAYLDKVWAIVGGVNGPSTHLAEQVVTKARITLINPVSTDKTVNLANVPWMFSCVPADHIQAPVLAEAINRYLLMSQRQTGKYGITNLKSQIENLKSQIALVSAVDHDSHLFAVELAKSFDQYQIAPAFHFEFDSSRPTESWITELVEKILKADPPAGGLVLIAGVRPSAQIVSALRQRGFDGAIFGGPSMGRRTFYEEAGEDAEGVIFPLLYPPGNSSRDDFEGKFAHRFGVHPDYTAAYTYDAVKLVIAAIRRAGLNRAQIRDAVRGLAPYQGVTGIIDWDGLGSPRPVPGAVRIGTIKNGRVQPLSGTASGAVTYRLPSSHLP